jgi:hypothetical protein
MRLHAKNNVMYVVSLHTSRFFIALGLYGTFLRVNLEACFLSIMLDKALEGNSGQLSSPWGFFMRQSRGVLLVHCAG